MSRDSGIAWTDDTANFWWGCLKVSEGCEHCYAETLSKRTGKDIWGSSKITNREYKKAIWKDLLKWDIQSRKEGIRRKVFVQSMSDFLEDHPQVVEWREEAKKLIVSLTNTDILMLTKRPENAERFLGDWYDNWPKYVWFGVSVENQKRADERISELLKVPAPILWLSVEPQLERIDLFDYIRGIDWVVVGGESGAHCRPFDLGWARLLLNECKQNNTRFFMKQLGGHPNKRDQMEDFPRDLRIREFPE